MGLPTDEMCQRMFYLLEPFIRWEIIFMGISHVPTHATKHENREVFRLWSLVYFPGR